MINSKQKGKTGELELAHLFTAKGMPARRSQQFKGTPDSADLEFDEAVLNKILHVECKRDEHLNVEKALQQAERDRGIGQFPIVCHRKNSDKWKVTMRFDDWIELFRCFRNVNIIVKK